MIRGARSAGAEWRGREDKDFYDQRKSAVTHCVITRFGLKSNTVESRTHEIVNIKLPRHIHSTPPASSRLHTRA